MVFVEALGTLETEFGQQLWVDRVFLSPITDEALIQRLMTVIITMESSPIQVSVRV